MIKRIVLIVAALAVTATIAAPAQASTPHEHTGFVGAGVCDPRGTTDYYVHLGDPIDAETILNSPYVFNDNKCEVNGFRLYKSVSNTKGEANFARKFLREDTVNSKKPVVYCRTDKTHAYFLDLAFYWGLFGASHLNTVEKNHYSSWAHKYAKRHGCHLFTPQS